MTSRWRRRACAVAIVAITATLAWAAGDNMSTLNVTPRMIGIRHQVGSSAQGTVMIANSSPTAFTGRIVANCGAPPAPRIFGGTGDPLTIAGNTTLPVQIDCPTTLSAGMHRCTFDIQNASNQSVASFFAFCVTHTQQVLTAAPTPVTFANQQVGVESTPFTLTISSSTGSAVDPMQLQVDNENFIVGSPCQNELGCDAGQLAAGSSANVDVLCKPLATGVHTGKLFLIGTNGIALTAPIDLSCGTGSGANLPVLTINPPNVFVNAIEIAGATTNATVELANGGSGMINVSSLDIVDNGIAGAANDWTIASLDGQCTTEVCSLGFQQKLNVRLTFDPSAFNSRPAKLVINYSDNQGTKQASVTLDGSGLGATAELVGTPSIELGTIPVNTLGGPQTFRVRNVGNRPTSLHLTASPMAPFLFPMDVPMDPGETTVNVTCMSSTEIDASVTLNLEGSDAPATLTVPMHCDVRDTGLTTNPSSITLGEIRMGSTVPMQPIAIDRVGAGMPIPLVSTALSDDQDPNLSLGALSGSATPAMVSLMIEPTVEQPIANAVVVTPGSGDPLSVPVTGDVVHVELEADDVMTLGTFCVGQPTSGTAVGLTSKGTATVVLHDVGLALGADTPFELEKTQPSAYPTSLAPNGGEAIVLVTPKRTDVPDDEVKDTLVWDTDAGPVSSVLTTRFVADGGAVAPDSLDFGDVEIRLVNDDAQGVTLQNCSTDPLQLIAPTVPPPFALTGEFPLFLEPGAKATFSILFLPTEIGEVTKSLTIESMGGDMFEVTLSGNGITGGGGGPGTGDDDLLDETSFYACGCRSGNNPSGVLAIAFALLAGGWRRRRAR